MSFFHAYVHPHPEIPVVMIRADHGTYPGVSGLNVGIDLTPAEARRVAGELIEAADQIDGRIEVAA